MKLRHIRLASLVLKVPKEYAESCEITIDENGCFEVQEEKAETILKHPDFEKVDFEEVPEVSGELNEDATAKTVATKATSKKIKKQNN